MTNMISIAALTFLVAAPLPSWLDWYAAPKVRSKEVTPLLLQYRTSLDMQAPSRFVHANDDGGINPQFTIKWDMVQAEKAKLDKLLKTLETRNYNGIEFACQGYFESDNVIVLTTLPKYSKRGLERLKELLKLKKK